MGKKGREKKKKSSVLDIAVPVRSIMKIPLERIQPNPLQPRKIFNEKELQELADSFKEEGDVDTAISVMMCTNDENVLIIDGERRWRAAQIAKLTMISCDVHRGLHMNQILIRSLRGNLNRAPMSPIEEAFAIKDIMTREKCSQKEVSVLTGLSPVKISNALKYLNLTKDIQALVLYGKLDKGNAKHIASYHPDDQIRLLRELQREIADNGAPIHPNDAIRILRRFAEELKISPLKPARGKKHTSHASLILSNIITKADSFKKALKELPPLTTDKITKETKIHPLSLLAELKMVHAILGEHIQRLGQEL